MSVVERSWGHEAPQQRLPVVMGPRVREDDTELNVKKHRLRAALQPQVEGVDGIAVASLALRNDRRAAIGGDMGQHGILGIALLVAEINPGIEMTQHAAREHGKQKMRRLRLAVGIGHRTRLDGVEEIAALAVGAGAAEAAKLRVRQRARILRIGETALALRLP